MYYGLLIYIFVYLFIYLFIYSLSIYSFFFDSVVNAGLSLSDAPVAHQQLVEILFKD